MHEPIYLSNKYVALPSLHVKSAMQNHLKLIYNYLYLYKLPVMAGQGLKQSLTARRQTKYSP